MELLNSGNVKFDENRLLILNAFQLIFPISVFLKLREFLIKEVGTEKCNIILKEIGKYQVQQGLKRYKKLLQINKLSIEKITEFGLKHIELLGMGKLQLIRAQTKPIHVIYNIINNPVAIEYKLLYKITNEPIDAYLSGILEGAYSIIFQKDINCMETLCIAKGDKVCQFEVREKI